MRFVSTMALGVALALGGAAIVGVAPASAKEKAEKPGKGPNLSKPVREAVVAAQAALAKGDTGDRANEPRDRARRRDDDGRQIYHRCAHVRGRDEGQGPGED